MNHTRPQKKMTEIKPLTVVTSGPGAAAGSTFSRLKTIGMTVPDRMESNRASPVQIVRCLFYWPSGRKQGAACWESGGLQGKMGIKRPLGYHNPWKN